MKSARLSILSEAVIAIVVLGIMVSSPSEAQFVTTAPPTWGGNVSMSVQPGQPTMGVTYGTGGVPGAAYPGGSVRTEYGAGAGVTRTVQGAGMPGYAPGAGMGTAQDQMGADVGYPAGDRLRMADEIATRIFGEELPKDELAKADSELGVARVMARNPDLTEADVPDIRTIEEYNEAAKLKLANIRIAGKIYRYTGGLSEYEPLNNPIVAYNEYIYEQVAPMVNQAISEDNAKSWPSYYMIQAWQAQQYGGRQGGQYGRAGASGYGQQGRGGLTPAMQQSESVVGSMGVGLDIYQQRAASGTPVLGRPGQTGTGRPPTGLQRGGYPAQQQRGAVPGITGRLPTGRY